MDISDVKLNIIVVVLNNVLLSIVVLPGDKHDVGAGSDMLTTLPIANQDENNKLHSTATVAPWKYV